MYRRHIENVKQSKTKGREPMNIQVTESALWWHEDEFRVDSEREDNSGCGGCADRWTVKHQEENDWKPALESFNITEMRGNAEASDWNRGR